MQQSPIGSGRFQGQISRIWGNNYRPKTRNGDPLGEETGAKAESLNERSSSAELMSQNEEEDGFRLPGVMRDVMADLEKGSNRGLEGQDEDRERELISFE